MTLQVSTGFKRALLANWPAIFDRGVIGIYNGVRPPTADDAATGSLLGIVTQHGNYWAPGDDANGLFYQSTGPWVMQRPGADWVARITRNGTATWFRVVGKAQDLGEINYDLPRVDGDISDDPDSGAELILPVVTLMAGDYVPIDMFLYTIPPIVGA